MISIIELIVIVITCKVAHAIMRLRPHQRVLGRKLSKNNYHPLLPQAIKTRELINFTGFMVVFALLILEWFVFQSENPLQSPKDYWIGYHTGIILICLLKLMASRARPNAAALEGHPDHSINQSLNSRQSFPSGHAWAGVFAAVFASSYLEDRMTGSLISPIVVRVIQSIIIISGLYPGYTQATRYWHFWSDVFAGYTIGAATSYITYNKLLTN